MGLTFSTKYLKGFLSSEDFNQIEPIVKEAHSILNSKECVAKGAVGWLNLPEKYNKAEFEEIKACAEEIRGNSDILVVIGIGGSYLGARAGIEFLNSPNYNLLSKNSPKILFVGNNISSSCLSEVLELCENKRVCVNVISKSGTTTEPAIAFRVFKQFMEKNFGKEEAKRRIFCTTDESKGILRQIAETEGYKAFTIPRDIGGRFSVLTAVGLLPIAVSGADIEKIMLGALEAKKRFLEFSLEENECYRYAAARNILYKKGKSIEILASYEPRFLMLLEWWKQLYGESEGKEGKGIFPTSLMYSTDLHSLGQFIQEGSRLFFETSLILKPNIKEDKKLKDEIKVEKIKLENNKDYIDGLNFLEGKTMGYINEKAYQATSLAHYDGGVPGMEIAVKGTSEKEFGELVYFFEKSCAISGLILGINPFNQPGVEEYKKNMFALLGKPGYENLKEKIMNRLNYS